MGKHRLLKNNFFGVICFAICLILQVSTATAKVYNAETFTLDNGLQVVVIPNHRAPVIVHSIWYKVGAADEELGSSGMAHYFEHLMFKGTKDIPPEGFTKIIKELGGVNNAFTSQDTTAYHQSIAVEHLERMMELEADRMVNLSVPKDHFESEKLVVLEERRQRTENSPTNRFYEQMRYALFANHPYNTPVIGWLHEIETYEWDDVKHFYDKWYAPNNAVVIISGDVTAKEVRPMAERTYGKLEPKDIPPRVRPEIPPLNSKTLLTLRHKSIGKRTFQQGFMAPKATANREETYALIILEEIMSGGSTTRLYKNLVVDQKKAVNAGLTYTGRRLDYGTIWISATPTQETSLEEIEELVHTEIRDVIDNGVTEEELGIAKQKLLDAAIFARDSLKGPVMNFGHTLTTGGTVDDVENWPDEISKVTAEQVQQVAKKYLDRKNPWLRQPVTGHLIPRDKRNKKKKESE